MPNCHTSQVSVRKHIAINFKIQVIFLSMSNISATFSIILGGLSCCAVIAIWSANTDIVNISESMSYCPAVALAISFNHRAFFFFFFPLNVLEKELRDLSLLCI